MMRSRFAIAFLLAAAACRTETRSAQPPPEEATTSTGKAAKGPDTGSSVRKPCSAASFDGRGVGVVRIGLPVDSLRALCPVVRDTTELRDEGMSAHVIDVGIGAESVEAEIVDGRVWRIAVRSAGLRTSDSLGVGTSRAKVLALPGAHEISGEGRTYVVSPARCGLSFRVAASVVSEVLIIGCNPPPGP
jgi:hypothetical protein